MYFETGDDAFNNSDDETVGTAATRLGKFQRLNAAKRLNG
jgi:hypothetical protein